MGLELDQSVVVATKQIFKFSVVNIQVNQDKSISAAVTFDVLNQNGERVGSKDLSFNGEEFNTFWAGFNSGTYLYQQLAKFLGIPKPADGSLESDFTNV